MYIEYHFDNHHKDLSYLYNVYSVRYSMDDMTVTLILSE